METRGANSTGGPGSSNVRESPDPRSVPCAGSSPKQTTDRDQTDGHYREKQRIAYFFPTVAPGPSCRRGEFSSSQVSVAKRKHSTQAKKLGNRSDPRETPGRALDFWLSIIAGRISSWRTGLWPYSRRLAGERDPLKTRSPRADNPFVLCQCSAPNHNATRRFAARYCTRRERQARHRQPKPGRQPLPGFRCCWLP
jgi:hypothetical protein